MRIFGAEKLSIFLIGKFLSRLLNLSLVGLLLIIAPNNPGKLLYPPFRQCIFENSLFQNGAYLISFDNDNSSATIKVWSNFHFSFSIILCLVQKKWYVQKILRGGWSGFGTALIWIDPNYFGSLCSNPNNSHESLDRSKLRLSQTPTIHPSEFFGHITFSVPNIKL